MTKATLTILGRIAFELSAGQIVEQHLETNVEQTLPTLTQRREHLSLVRHHLVQAAIQLVDLLPASVLYTGDI